MVAPTLLAGGLSTIVLAALTDAQGSRSTGTIRARSQVAFGGPDADRCEARTALDPARTERGAALYRMI